MLREDPPKQGANVFLTIDARIQTIAEEALRAVGRAAAVVVDPNNGNILAMVSVPSFDPNTFIPSIKVKDWEALQKGRSRIRWSIARSAHFRPARPSSSSPRWPDLRQKIWLTPSYNCGGGVSYGDHFFHCWIAEKAYTHGTHRSDRRDQSFLRLLFLSVRQRGRHPVDRSSIGKMLGIGEESGLHLTGEQPGIMPGPEWMQIHHPQERWSQALHRQRFDRAGLHAGFAAATGHGLCHGRQWRHLLLPALDR